MAVELGVSDESYGLTQSKKVSESLEVAEAKQGDGKVAYQAGVSVTKDVEVNVVVTGTLPTIGSVDSTDGLVVNVDKTSTAGKYAEATVKFQKKDDATQTAYGTQST